MKYFATDPGGRFVVFCIDRGGDKLNAYVWVNENGGLRATDLVALSSFCNQVGEPLYVGDDVPNGLLDKASDIVNNMSDDDREGIWSMFSKRMDRIDPDKYQDLKEYELAILKEAEKAKQRDGLLWV